MSIARELTLRNLDHLYQSSISHQLASYGLSLNYGLLPQDVVHEAKRYLLNTLASAIGAYEGPGRPMLEAVAKKLGGLEEATVFGSGLRTTAVSAALINAYLVNLLDYSDTGTWGQGHDSDSLSSIVAVAEREKSSGRDLLTSLVINNELGARYGQAKKAASPAGDNWQTTVKAGLILPPALGRLMGLNEEQIANAIGLCASQNLPLRVLDTATEDTSMGKSTCFGFAASNAVFCCMLAQEGFTGPARVVEGESGLNDAIFQGKMALDKLVDFSGWRILRSRQMRFPGNAAIQGQLMATLDIVKENDLKPEDIAAVQFKASVGSMALNHTSSAIKRYPRTAEGANHSTFYLNAIAIKERDVGINAFEPKNFTDPVILGLIDKMSIEIDPSFSKNSQSAASEITTKDGRKLQKRLDIAGNYGFTPLTDKEIEEKFRKMAVKYMDENQIKKIFDAVWNAEKLDDTSQLVKLLVFPSSRSK